MTSQKGNLEIRNWRGYINNWYTEKTITGGKCQEREEREMCYIAFIPLRIPFLPGEYKTLHFWRSARRGRGFQVIKQRNFWLLEAYIEINELSYLGSIIAILSKTVVHNENCLSTFFYFFLSRWLTWKKNKRAWWCPPDLRQCFLEITFPVIMVMQLRKISTKSGKVYNGLILFYLTFVHSSSFSVRHDMELCHSERYVQGTWTEELDNPYPSKFIQRHQPCS